jgi:diguanylate cyclase (GGDEF)-like protein
LRISIEEEVVEHNDLRLSVTISIGITSFNHDVDLSKQTFIERADAALYESKNKGRNQVTFFE